MSINRVASIDLGSNSFLLLISERDDQGQLCVIEDICLVTQLAQGVQKHKFFHKDALERANKAFEHFFEKIKYYGVSNIKVVSTSAARDVTNKQEFLDLGLKYNFHIQIISGEKEAELSFLGATFDQEHIDESFVLDIGGGSTEFIYKQSHGLFAKSIDMGAVRLREMFITGYPIKKSEGEDLRGYIRKLLKENFSKENFPKKMLAVAGTPVTLAGVIQAIEFNENKIHGFRITLNDLNLMTHRLSKMDLNEIKLLKGMDEKRAHVIYAGASILYECLEYFNLPDLKVSTKGLRYGLALR
ncbi:MAG: hypothetical protein HOO06_00990 [Bdellovibrionaceae bacterium]|jgi:exopolyphosphatase / guanosine-5'-triphosphate,3'-diphosphate pyrophosphatase|nr:hypothetical protein [Pseudobdellovibrionaceae bacterium]